MVMMMMMMMMMIMMVMMVMVVMMVMSMMKMGSGYWPWLCTCICVMLVWTRPCEDLRRRVVSVDVSGSELGRSWPGLVEHVPRDSNIPLLRNIP